MAPTRASDWTVIILGLVLATCLAPFPGVSGLPTIEIKGSKFFTSDGDQFYIKGITYDNVNSTNYLTHGAQCQIDAPLIAQTGANVVRVYSVDPTLQHDECMQAFADAGIYVICDMSTPTYYIDRNKPNWTMDLRNQFAKVLDGFHQYDNLLALFAGNEVVDNPDTSNAAPVIKAVIADMKAYRDLMQYRKIPIGYSATDTRTAPPLQDYLDCGNSSIAADFFALNSYSWCGDSSFTTSGYDQLYARADGYDIPIFLSETGCTAIRPRDFSDQVAILGRQMNDRFSGSIIYEWHNQSQNYGIAQYPNSALTGTPSLLPEYTSLKDQWATLTPIGVSASAYNPSLTKRACPSSSVSYWSVDAAAGTKLPTLGLSGFSGPDARVTATKSDSDPAKKSGGAKNGNGSKSSGLGGGAIAGIIIGVLAALAILIGAIFLLLRRRRKARGNAMSSINNNGSIINGHSEMAAFTPNDSPSHKTTTTIPELGPPRSHELRGDQQHQVSELPYQQDMNGYHHYQHEHGQQPLYHEQEPSVPPIFHNSPPDNVADASSGPPAGAESEHVLAQRRREVEWLEQEEARMRQRREQLLQQQQSQQNPGVS